MSIGHYGFAFFIFLLASLLIILYNYLFSDMKRQKKLLDEKENKLLRLYQSVEEALDDFHDSVERSHGEITGQLRELGELHAEVERSMRGLAAHAPARIERHEAAAARRPAAQAQMTPPAAQQPARAAAPQAAPAAAPQAARGSEGEATLADSIGQAAANIRAAAPVSATAPSAQAAEPVQEAHAAQQMSPPPVFRQVLEAVEQVEPLPPPPAPGRNEMILKLAQEGRLRSQIAKELGITLSEVDLVIGMNR